MTLAGEVAFITGASRGMGAACARELARAGAPVVLAARSLDRSNEIAREIEAGGGQAAAVACDVADVDSVGKAFARARERFGPIRILVNNAGVVEPIARLEALSPADLDAVLAVNLHGAFYALHAALPDLLAADGSRPGTLVNVSSGAAHRPLEAWASYCISKAGLHMLTQALALELGERIRVFGFQPGTVDTEMQGAIRRSGLNPISRMSREQHRPPEVPAAVIRWLCTPEADDLAGQELSILDEALRARAGVE